MWGGLAGVGAAAGEAQPLEGVGQAREEEGPHPRPGHQHMGPCGSPLEMEVWPSRRTTGACWVAAAAGDAGDWPVRGLSQIRGRS